MNKGSKRKKMLVRKDVRTGAKSVISQNTKRGMQEVVLINEDDKGRKYSVTRHEPIDPKAPFRPYGKQKEKEAA